MLRAISLVALLGVWGFGSTSLAQTEAVEASDAGKRKSLDAEARSLFEAGSTAYQDGRYDAALDYFRKSFELSDRPQLLYNIAQAADRLRKDEEALEALRAYRRSLPDAPNRAQVDSRIATLEAQLQQEEAEATPAPQLAPVAQAKPAASAPSALDANLQTAAATPTGARDDGSLLSQWWFWTGAAVVVAGAVAGVALATTGDDTVEDPAPGTDGVVVVTLSRR